MGKQAAKAKKRKDGPDYEWTEADYKRASAPSSLDFVRFSALRSFDRQNGGVDNKSSRAYALLINKRIRDIDDVPDTTTTHRKRKKMEESSSRKTDKKKKKKKESFDPDSPAMQEEIERRVKYATELHKKNKERMKGKKKEGDDDETMGREFVRRINWSYDLNKKCGPAAVDAAAKLFIDAEKVVYSS